MGKRKRDGFYKRDGSPYWWTRDPRDGQRKSTRCKDLEAARLTRARWERAAADPAHAASETAQLGEWTQRFIAWKERTSSAATVSVARQKLGHWNRVFGASCSLSFFSEPSAFDAYLTKRRAEKASDHTISKEVAHMLAVLKLAKRAKCFAGDLSTLRPPDLHAGYKPRKRALNRQELARLLAALEPRRGALVAVCVALGCRLGEAFRLLPTDFSEEVRDLPGGGTYKASRVFLRGTKTDESERWVPILSLYRPLLEAARPFLPLEPWGKVQRDLKVACKRAGIAPCSPNDLRRTHATLLAEAGVDADVTRRLLGHTTRNLVDRVYGQPSTEALAGLAEGKLLGAAPLLGATSKDYVGWPSSDPCAGRRDLESAGQPRTHAAGRDVETGSIGAIDQYGAGPGCSPGGPRPIEVRLLAAPPGSEVTATSEIPTLADGVRLLAGPPVRSEDVTIEPTKKPGELETSIIPSAPGPDRTADLRFRKAIPSHELDAGILGFRGDALRWIPPDAPGFGRERQAVSTLVSQ